MDTTLKTRSVVPIPSICCLNVYAAGLDSTSDHLNRLQWLTVCLQRTEADCWPCVTLEPRWMYEHQPAHTKQPVECSRHHLTASLWLTWSTPPALTSCKDPSCIRARSSTYPCRGTVRPAAAAAPRPVRHALHPGPRSPREELTAWRRDRTTPSSSRLLDRLISTFSTRQPPPALASTIPVGTGIYPKYFVRPASSPC